MKRLLFLLLATALISPALLADPPDESGVVLRSEYPVGIIMWGTTGPMLIIGFSVETAQYYCAEVCNFQNGEEECPFSPIEEQFVVNPSETWPWLRKGYDMPASLWPNPFLWGTNNWCDVVNGLGPYGEGTGDWKDIWTGTQCPETEQRSWRSQGRVMTYGPDPISINFNAGWHCLVTCDGNYPTCYEEVRTNTGLDN